MAKVLEALISKGRRVRRAAEQKEVAFGLADLSTHEELLERMVQKGSVKSLLYLLTKSSDKDARRFAALSLGNLASAPFNRTRIASEGTIPILINFMKDADSDVISRQFCAMALGNLAAEPDNHLEIVKSDGIEALLAVLRTEDVDAGRYAAFGLANIGANANHRDRVVELGAVPNLISLACSEDLNAQKQALAALRSICISPEFRAVAVREGIMDPLVLLSRVEDIGILRDVASALNCLSSVEENKIEIAERAMSTIIGLMLSGDFVIERHAVCAAANLMEMVDLHVKLTEEKGVAPIVAVSSSRDTNSRGEACRCLANLSVNPDMHQLIIREGSLGPLVGALKLQELNCQRYASLCLANLSTTVAAQVKVIQTGAVKPLIDLGTNPRHQIEARRYAALALANLTATAANHISVIEDGGLQAFFSLCNSPDLMSQYYVGCALANLSCSLSNHFVIVEQGGLQALITLASSKDPDVHQQAAAALRGLAVTPVNKMKIVQEGALGPLTSLLSSEDVEILREVVACFCNLSVSEENKLEIVKCGTIAAFISLSQSADMIVASMACATLANLAETSANQCQIAEEGAIRPTISAMRSKYIEVQREAGRLLANLCASKASSTSHIINSGGHSLLISYLLSQDTACQRVGSMGICNLCTQPNFRKILMECGVVEPLCSLARSEDVELEIQRYAILAIANLASAIEIHQVFIEEGMLSLLISLSTANDAEVRQFAAYAVTKIAQNADVRKAVTEEGGLEAVLYLARTADPDIQREVLIAITSLSFADANKVAICRNGGLESIVNAISDRAARFQRLGCCALANLSEIVENFDRIYDSAVVIPLTRVLAESDESVKCEASRAIGNLSANIELADEFLREGVLSHLLPMIRSTDPQCQRIGAFALSNLSSNVRDQSILLRGGLFEVLMIEITQSLDPKSRSDYECTRYCLLILSNLAVNFSNHPLLMKQALPILSQFSKHRDIKCRQHAVFCIANLCCNNDNLEDIVATGCLRTIITYAFPSSDSSSNVQFQAISALRGLSTHSLIRIQLVREGALEPLIICSRSPSIEVQRETAATLCNIALAEENKVILARGGALTALIELAMCGDKQRELHAAAALANIAEMVEGRTQERMIEEGTLKPLLRLSESDDSEVRREVARAFALFASKHDSHSALVRVHATARMMTFLLDIDDTCKRYGALGIANLAVSRNTHQELFDVGAVQKLLEIVNSVDVSTKRAVSFAFNNLSSNPSNHTACERIGIIRAIVSLLKDHDRDTNLQAIVALRHLCESSRIRHQLVELKGMPAIFELGRCEDVETKREVAAALRNLSLSENCKVSIVENDGLHLICEMLNHSDTEISHQAAGVIANLAEATENQGIMVDHGVIQHFKFIMRSKSIDIQREGARAMANISAEYSFAGAIVAAGALISLITMLSSPDFLCQRYAVMGIGNLASNPINQKKIVQEGAIPPLLSLAKFENGDLESQKFAVISLTNLSATKSNHSIMIDLGCLTLMKMLMHHENSDIRGNAIFFIANLSSNPNNHSLLMQEKCLETIIDILFDRLKDDALLGSINETNISDIHNIVDASSKSNCLTIVADRNVQSRILSCIRGLSTDANIRLDLLNMNILDPLLKLSKSDDLDIQMEALACLCNMSLCGCIGENPDGFLDSITVKNLIAFLCSADSTYRLFGAVAIGNIASSLPLQESLVYAGTLAPLVAVANASDLETQRCISYALCNLASNPSRRYDIVREGGLSSIISMACSDDIGDLLTALSTLRGIASQAENRRAVYKANILEAINIAMNTARMISNVNGVEIGDSLETKCEVAALLCALSIDDENKLEMIEEPVILENLIYLLSPNVDGSFGDTRYLRPTVSCLANISEITSCHEKLRKYRTHQNILRMFTEVDIPLVREAARMLANMSSNIANQESIIACGGISTFVSAAHYDDVIVTRFCIIGLMNLAAFQDNHAAMLREAATDILIQSAKGCYRTWHHFDRLGNTIIEESSANENNDSFIYTSQDITSRREVMNILRNGDEASDLLEFPRSKRDSAFLKQHGYDKESRRFALLALGNLSISSSSHDSLMSEECIEALKDALVSEDEETRFNAAFALNKLTIDQMNQSRFSQHPHVIERLVQTLQFERNNGDAILLTNGMNGATIKLHCVGQSLGALRHLALSAENRLKILSFNLLEPLATIASSMTASVLSSSSASTVMNELEILREISALSCILSLSEAVRSAIVGSALLLPLVELCSSDDVEISRQACGAIANLSESKRTHKRLATLGNTMHKMIFVMKSQHLSVHREASRAVANMLSSSAFHRLFLDDGGLSSLFRLCKSLDVETLYNCSLIYRKLSPVVANHEYIIGKGGLNALLTLTKTQDLAVNQQASAALRDLSSNPIYKVVIAETCLKRAIELAADENSELRILGMGTLRHLAVHSRLKATLVEQGALIPLFLSIEDKNHDLDLLRQCSAILSYVSESFENQVELIRSQVLPRLIFMSNILCIDVKVDIARCYASMTSNPVNISGVFGLVDLKAIMNLVSIVQFFRPRCIVNSSSDSNTLPQWILDASTEQIESCARDALLSIGNLAIVEINQHLITDAGLFQWISPCLDMLNGSESIQRFAAKIIFRLAANTKYHNYFLDAGLVHHLNLLSASKNDLIRKYAVMALCNLSTNIATQSKVAKLGSLGPLINCLRDSQDIIARYAVMAITNLTINSNNQKLVMALGAMSTIISLAEREFGEISRFAGMALSNLSTHRQNRIAVVSLNGLVPFISMARSKSLESQRAAALGLYNISCASSNHVAMINAKTVPVLTELLQSNDLECKRFSIMTLGNLAANVETRSNTTRSGGLQTAIKLLKDPDSDCRRYACIALCNMAVAPITQEQIVVHGALPKLLTMAKDFSEVDCQRQALLTLNNVASNELNHSALLHRDVMRILLEAFQGSDPYSKEYAAFVVASLCTSSDFIAMIGLNGGIPPLIMLSKSENANAACVGIASLRQLAMSEENWIRLIDAGILESLASAGYSPEIEIQKEISACLCSLSLCNSHKMEIAVKCMKILIHLTLVGETEVIRRSLGAIANLAEYEPTHSAIDMADGYSSVIRHMMNDTIEIQREASRCISNMLSSLRYHSRMLSATGFSSTVNETSSNSNGISAIIDIVRLNRDEESVYNASLALRKLSPNLLTHPKLIEEKCFDALMILVDRSQNFKIRKHGATILRDILSNPDYKWVWFENYGVRGLVQLVKDSDETLQALGYACFRHITLNPEINSIVMSDRREIPNDTVEDLDPLNDLNIASVNESFQLSHATDVSIKNLIRYMIKASKIVHEDIHLQLIGFIANLSEDHRNQILLIESNMVTFLVHLSYLRYPVYVSSMKDFDESVISSESANVEAVINLEIIHDLSRIYANLLTNEAYHVKMYDQGILNSIFYLSKLPFKELQQKQHLKNQSKLTNPSTSNTDIIQKYLSICIKFLICNNEIRNASLRDNFLQSFVELSKQSNMLEYQLTSSIALASLSVVDENKCIMIRDDDCLRSLYELCNNYHNLTIQRNAINCLANLCEFYEEMDKFVENNNVFEILIHVSFQSNDAKIQRDLARAFALLSKYSDIQLRLLEYRGPAVKSSTEIPVLDAILQLTKSLDIQCQRYSTLALANLCCCAQYKAAMVDAGIVSPLLFLMKFSDAYMQKYCCLAIGGLALGGYNNNKQALMKSGLMTTLIQMISIASGNILGDSSLSEDKDNTLLYGVLTLSCLLLGNEPNLKSVAMTERSVSPLLNILRKYVSLPKESFEDIIHNSNSMIDIITAVVYVLGSMSEHNEVKQQLIDVDAVNTIVKQFELIESTALVLQKKSGNSQYRKVTIQGGEKDRHVSQGISSKTVEHQTSLLIHDQASSVTDIKRATGYIFASLSERLEYHSVLYHSKAFEVIIKLASMEDIECQEYAAFALAHLASNREYQVTLVNLNAVRPLVTMLSSDAEPKHYAGLALLKLADNFENHQKIAEAGGIQALLRLGRMKSVDDQLQYKAAVSVGQLASNAIRLLPSGNQHKPKSSTLERPRGFSTRDATSDGRSVIGHGARMLNKMRGDVENEFASNPTTQADIPVPRKPMSGADIVSTYLNQSMQAADDEARRSAEQLRSKMTKLSLGPISSGNRTPSQSRILAIENQLESPAKITKDMK